MAGTKLTKAKLISQLDDKIQTLNLLKAALQAESHLKQADLEGYKKRFDEIVSGKVKK